MFLFTGNIIQYIYYFVNKLTKKRRNSVYWFSFNICQFQLGLLESTLYSYWVIWHFHFKIFFLSLSVIISTNRKGQFLCCRQNKDKWKMIGSNLIRQISVSNQLNFVAWWFKKIVWGWKIFLSVFSLIQWRQLKLSKHLQVLNVVNFTVHWIKIEEFS